MKKAKVFSLVAAQGEITIRRVIKFKFKGGVKRVEPVDGQFIIGHSETGHNHVIEAKPGLLVNELEKPPAGMRILHLIAKDPFVLTHLREFDTHEPIAAEPGIYEIRIAREYDPYEELARISAD